jgi:hypothetical protein
MSRANIVSTEEISPNHVRVKFKTATGHRVYDYKGSSARAFKRGSEPADLAGRLVETVIDKKPKK